MGYRPLARAEQETGRRGLKRARDALERGLRGERFPAPPAEVRAPAAPPALPGLGPEAADDAD